MDAPWSSVKTESSLETESGFTGSSGNVAGSASQTAQMHPTFKPEPNADATQVSRMIRNPEGMRLVGNDEVAFDGFADLQRWVQANESVLKQGKILFSNDPFTSPTIAAISTLAPIFGI